MLDKQQTGFRELLSSKKTQRPTEVYKHRMLGVSRPENRYKKIGT